MDTFSSFPSLEKADDSSTSSSLVEFLPLALRCAGAAGAEIATVHARRWTVKVDAVAKGNQGFDQVTETDAACEKLIFGMIRADERCASHAFVGEEGCADANSVMASLPFDDITWVCDPLDGTKNFVKGLEHVAVCVGLAKRGQTRVGVVYCPVLSEVFFAAEGHGAYVAKISIDAASHAEGLHGLATAVESLGHALGTAPPSGLPPSVHRLDRAAKTSTSLLNLKQSMVSTNCGHYRDGTFAELTTKSIGSLITRALGLRMLGSCAIGMCHVAASRSDAYYERNIGGPWDVAAASVIVREAGGCIRDCNGSVFSLRPGKQRILAAANGRIATELGDLLGSIEAEVEERTRGDHFELLASHEEMRWRDHPAEALLSFTGGAFLQHRASFLSTLSKLDLRGALGERSMLPEAIGHCGALTLLDIGDNALEALPSSLARCTRLKILFATGNKLGRSSGAGMHVCARMVALTMLSIKSNDFVVLDTSRCLPPQLEWLIATDNKIAAIPGLGSMHAIRKLMLSHNALTTAALIDAGLGDEAACVSLEMIRLANNNIGAVPPALLRHPHLAWLALGGNPCSTNSNTMRKTDAAEIIDYGDITGVDDDTILGSGTSGCVVACQFRGRRGALKMWSAGTFSDGTAEDEWALNRTVGSHPNLVAPIAFVSPPSAPGLGMVMEYLAEAKPLGGPPTFATITRDNPDIDPQKHAFQTHHAFVGNVAQSVCSALRYLHEERGVLHGDVYAHNILVSRDGVVKLGDLGAASMYVRKATTSSSGEYNEMEKCEVRAFGWLLADMYEWMHNDGEAAIASSSTTSTAELRCSFVVALKELIGRCTAADINTVPTFAETQKALEAMMSHQ